MREPEPIRWPSMLLVGGAGRNSGKTRFCCSLIERLGSRHRLIGLKVTAIRETGGTCPRGNDDCGVCTSLVGNYEISEETGQPAGKDTSLMLASGAERVLWLRVKREHLAEGTAALLERVGPDRLCICESNSLRHVVEPGVFVIVKEKASERFKPSAREVLHLADRVVLSAGEGFDLGSDGFEIVGNAWRLSGRANDEFKGQSRR